MKSIKKLFWKSLAVITLSLFLGLGSGLLFNSTTTANVSACSQSYCPDPVIDPYLFCPATDNWVQCVNLGSIGCYHTGC